MGLVLKLVIYAAALWVAVRLIDGLELTGGALALLAIAVVFAVVNALVKPIVSFLSLPLVLLTLGLFLLVVNALMLALTIAISGALSLGLTAPGGFGAIFLGALVISVVTWVAELVTGSG